MTTDLVEYVDGIRIVTPEQPLEPSDCWREKPNEPNEEETDNGIDLDDGWVLQMGKGWRKMTKQENREMEYLHEADKLYRLGLDGLAESREDALQCCQRIMELLGAWPVVVSTEGHKAFRGTMHITPGNPAFPPCDLEGDWLYKPDTGCWYCKGRSYPASTCEIVRC